jgi:peptidoglycan hydrolase CwlO-like protein
MDNKEAYINKMKAQLNEWDAEIDKLKAKYEKVSADTALEYQKQIDDLKSKRAAAENKITELKESSGDAWEELKSGIENAWTSLGEAIKSARSKF